MQIDYLKFIYLFYKLLFCYQIDLADVKARFRERAGRTLEEAIRRECSGSYKNLLLAIVKDK